MHTRSLGSIGIILIMLLVPVWVRAEVTISEVAWMGTANSQYEEWIELYNDGASQSLDGWKIYKAGGSTSLITLSGTISAGQYFLVCRTTPSVVSPLAGACDVTGTFGGSGLNNTSEHILLKDSGATTIDDIDATSGWPAGNASTKDTMQKSSSGWISAAGTPGAGNATSGNDNGGNNNENNNNGNGNGDGATDDGTTPADDTAGSQEQATVFPTMLLKVDAPKIAIAGSPVHVRAQALDFDRSDIFKGHYTWNMGDGTVREFALGFRQTNDGFDYTYAYPGTYVVDVKYFHSYLNGVPAELEQKFIIDVVAATVSISKIYPDGAIELKNTSGNTLDISQWQLRDVSGAVFTFAPDTFISSGKSAVFPMAITKLKPFAGVSVFTPSGALAASSIAPVSYTSSSSQQRGATSAKAVGEVLGAEVAATTTPDTVVQKKPSGSHTLLYIMAFIILVLVAVIAVLFLRTKDTAEQEYELIDE